MRSLEAAGVLPLGEEETRSLRDYWAFYERYRDALQADLQDEVMKIPEFVPLMRAMTPEMQKANNERSFALQRAAILEGRWQEYLADLAQQGAVYARMNLAFSSWFKILHLFRDALIRRMTDDEGADPQQVLSAIRGMSRFMDIAMMSIGEAYLETKEEVISRQQEAIREISTPVLQVRDRLLLVPIIGVVDTHRARQLTADLLRAIRDRRARVVVMDITGVPIVDSKVANHFIQTVEAAKLMGALVILTGVSPEIAQTLVSIGADLGSVQTVGDMQEGLEEGERMLGLEVVSVKARGNGSSPGRG